MQRLRINEGDAALVVRKNEAQEIVLAPDNNTLGLAELTIIAMSLWWSHTDDEKRNKMLKRAKAYIEREQKGLEK